MCDFLNSQGQCGVWEFRPSECTSFYCAEEMKRSQNAKFDDSDSPFTHQSRELFDLELEWAQHALRHKGYSWRKISGWIDDWNAFTDVGEGMQEAWPLSREERFQFYRESWMWLKQQRKIGL